MNPLIRLIPPPLVRFFARPYVAGDSLAAAMDAAARQLSERHLVTTLDLLSEGVDSDETVQRNVEVYLEMVDAAASDPRFGSDNVRPTLSLKPSSYTTDPLEEGGTADSAREAMFQIAEYAAQKGIGLTVDMESRHWTDFTLDTIRDLHRAGQTHVGAVLQTRLNRTRDDLDGLPPRCRVRLVIGIYEEPEAVATTDKREMKERMLEYADILLKRGHYVEFATHDERYVRRFLDEVAPANGAGKDSFEVQMLYGVPRAKLLGGMVAKGVTARLYVPFALSWSLAVRYLRRRLDEYPAMMLLVLKNLLLRS